jgi:hypothetical protein
MSLWSCTRGRVMGSWNEFLLRARPDRIAQEARLGQGSWQLHAKVAAHAFPASSVEGTVEQGRSDVRFAATWPDGKIPGGKGYASVAATDTHGVKVPTSLARIGRSERHEAGVPVAWTAACLAIIGQLLPSRTKLDKWPSHRRSRPPPRRRPAWRTAQASVHARSPPRHPSQLRGSRLHGGPAGRQGLLRARLGVFRLTVLRVAEASPRRVTPAGVATNTENYRNSPRPRPVGLVPSQTLHWLLAATHVLRHGSRSQTGSPAAADPALK